MTTRMRDLGGRLGSSGTFATGGVFSLNFVRNALLQNSWGGQLVANGLVLNLDASNPASYPGSGTTWFDLSPSGLHATGSSAITGQALDSSQPYNTASTGILNTDTHSLFFSIQLNTVSGGWAKIFGYEPSGTDRSPGVWRYPNSRTIHWRYDPNNTGDFDFNTSFVGTYSSESGLSSGNPFLENTWYYVGVSKNGSTVTVYVNGVRIGSNGAASNPKTAGNSPIRLFQSHNGSSKIRHVHAYNRVITDAEVLSNFAAVRGSLGI